MLMRELWVFVPRVLRSKVVGRVRPLGFVRVLYTGLEAWDIYIFQGGFGFIIRGTTFQKLISRIDCAKHLRASTHCNEMKLLTG
jgi:hypothetical protein